MNILYRCTCGWERIVKTIDEIEEVERLSTNKCKNYTMD